MFLVSAFKNSGSSAAGPDAFLDFWHDCYEGIPRLAATCPAELFGYLKGYAEVCGRSIADDSSVTSAVSRWYRVEASQVVADITTNYKVTLDSHF